MDLGTLQYNVVADTTGLDKANTAMDGMTSKAQQAEKAVDSLGDTISSTSKQSTSATKAMNDEFNRLSSAMNKQISLYGKFGREAEIAYETAQGSLSGLSAQQKTALLTQAKQVDELSKSFRGMRGVAQSAGYQLQDIAVQAQMGTSAFVILGQQGSQFAASFGPTGAVVGAVLAVGAAVGGVLFASFMAASKAVENLEENVKSLIKEYDQLTLAQKGIVDRGVGLAIDNLIEKHKEEQKVIDEKSESIRKLTAMDGQYITVLTGKGQSTRRLIDNTNEIAEAEKELIALQQQRTVTEREIEALRDPTGAQKQITQLQNESALIGLTGRAYWELKAAQEGVADAYRESLVQANLNVEATKKFNEALQNSVKIAQEAADKKLAANKKAAEAEEKRAEAIDKQIKQMQKQAALVGNTSRYAEALYDVKNGLIDIRKEEEAAYLAAAKKLDAANTAAQEQKEYIDAYNQWVKEQRKAESEATKQSEKEAEARAKFSEDAAERINGAFASAWVGIMDDADSAFDGIEKSFKQLIAEMAHEALTKPIVMNIQQAMTSGGTSATQGGSGAMGAIGMGGIYAAGAMLAIAAVSSWNKKQDEKFVKMTAEYRQGVQSTGTLLGMANTKSDSIAQAMESLGDLSGDMLNVNRGMYMSLQSIDAGINGVAAGFARQLGLSGGVGVNVSGLGTSTPGPGESLKKVTDALFFDNLGGEILAGFANSITDSISKAVYNEKKKIIDSGIKFVGQSLADILTTGAVNAFAYADIKSTKSVIGVKVSSKVKTKEEELNEILSSQFAKVFGSAGDALEQAAGVFGLDFENYISKLIIDPQKLSLKGLEGDALTKEIEAFFSSTLDNWAGVLTDGSGVLEQFQQVGEGAFETVIRLASELNTFNYYAKALRLDFGLIGFAAVDAQQKIAEAAGGFDQLTASLSGYYENFFSESERSAAQMEMLSKALKDLGINTVPSSREAFRDLIEGLDLSDESNQKLFASLINLQGVFADLVPAIDGASDSIGDMADKAMSALDKAVSAEKKIIDAQMASVNSALDASRSVYSALESALSGMSSVTASTQAATRRQAQAQLGSMLQSAQGGKLPDINDLNNALSTLSQPTTNLYTSFDEYIRDFDKTAQSIKALKDVAGTQVTAEEAMLASLEQQSTLLDEMLAWSKQQVDSLNGIDTSVLSVTAAINNLSAIVGVQYQTPVQARNIELSQRSYNSQPQEATQAEIDQQRQAQEMNAYMKSSQLAIVDNSLQIKKLLDKFDRVGVPLRSETITTLADATGAAVAEALP